jgi:hypothetical protein
MSVSEGEGDDGDGDGLEQEDGKGMVRGGRRLRGPWPTRHKALAAGDGKAVWVQCRRPGRLPGGGGK